MGKVEQIEALEYGHGIQYFLNRAYEIFNNPVYVLDINYNLLAHTNTPYDDPFWNELVTTGTFSLDTVKLMANENLLEDITNADKTTRVENEILTCPKLMGHIYNRDNIRVALMVMSEHNTLINGEGQAAFEALTEKITREIRDYDYFSMLTMTFHEEKINLLLDGAVNNPLLYNPQAQILYSGLDDYLYVAVLSVARNEVLPHVHRNRLAYFMSMLKTKFQSFKFSVYNDHIVMLMSSKHKYFYGAAFFAAYAGLFEQNGITLGISGAFESLYDLRKYYDQAVTVLVNGLEYNDGQRIFLHNDD